MPATARIIDVAATPVPSRAGRQPQPVLGLFFPYPANSSRKPARTSPKPLPAKLAGFILQHADLETDLPDGRVLLSFSARKLNNDALRARLGWHLAAVRKARVIWNPATGEISATQG